jgi:putative multiple sugar transport system substrate-binding protein
VRKILVSLSLAALALSLAACGGDAVAADSVYANEGALVGVVMPNSTSDRWVGDGDAIRDQLKGMGYKVDLKFSEDKEDVQQKQVQAMIDENVKLLMISAYKGDKLTVQLANAAAKHIPVIAYDRNLLNTPNVAYQATFDNVRVGELQAQFIIDNLNLNKNDGKTYNVELFAGSPDDSNAHNFYSGAFPLLNKYIKRGKIKVLSGQTKFDDVAIEAYSSPDTEKRMTKNLNQYYQNDRLDAVLSPYDGMSRSVVDAVRKAGYGTKASDKPMPIITGQDSETDSVQSIIDGYQTQTIFKDTRELAKVAVEQANALLTGGKPMVNDTTTFTNGYKLPNGKIKAVPTYVLYPVEVTKSNYKTLLIGSGYTPEKDLKIPS